jgi:hydrogenase assembly chaperone HypC/HupF
MCTPTPAQVISMEADKGLVDSNGRQMAVGCLIPMSAQPGDWVLVYLGHVISRVSPEEAGALQELLQAMRAGG